MRRCVLANARGAVVGLDWGGFLGVPILVAGVPIGNLYLTEKTGGARFSPSAGRDLSRCVPGSWV